MPELTKARISTITDDLAKKMPANFSEALENSRQQCGNEARFLFVYACNPRFGKITIYPVPDLPISKLSIIGKPGKISGEVEGEIIEKIALIVEPLHLIHTTGIMHKTQKFVYEAYFLHQYLDKATENKLEELKGHPGIDEIRLEEVIL